MENVMVEEPEAPLVPYLARWIEQIERPMGSTDMRNPDTSTSQPWTEDYDT